MPGQFTLPPILLLGPAVAAAALYVLLRWVVWAPKTGTSPTSVSEHALWVGVIGWLVSSLQGGLNVGIIPANPVSGGPLTSAAAIAPALAWPILGCLGVHAIGQVSYPGPRRTQRQAVLSARRIRDFLPRRLAVVTAVIFAAAGALIVSTANLPGFPPSPPVTVGEGASTHQTAGADGRIPGVELAAWLGGSLVLLAAGTLLVLWLTASRRQLEALDAADNAVLRTIAMNRLLRTVSTVAAGLGVIAGNFAARPDPSSGISSWANQASFAGMAVLLVMFVWQPPRMAAAEPGDQKQPVASRQTGDRHPAVRLVSSLGPLLGLAAAVPLLAGAFILPGLMADVAAFGMAGFVALMAVMVLLVIAGGELLLQRNYGDPAAPRDWPRQPVGPALLTTALLASVTFTLVLAVTAAGQVGLYGTSDWGPPALLAATGVVAAAPPLLAARRRHGVPGVEARRRHGVPGVEAGMDAALRAVTVHRAVRTLASMLTAQAAVLLLTQGLAWAAVFGGSILGEPFSPSGGSWWPATVAGAVLATAATVIAVIPVGGLSRAPANPPVQRDREPSA